MTLGPMKFLGELFRSLFARIIAGALTAMAVYQFGCDQFGWPTLPDAWQFTGARVPWWGWALALQAMLTLALFEFVRRNHVPVPNAEAGPHRAEDPAEVKNGQPATQPGSAPLKTPALVPDMDYDELLRRVIGATVSKAEVAANAPAAKTKVYHAIIDTISFRKPYIWARYGDRPIERLANDQWNRGTLNLMHGTLNIVQGFTYTDLKFNRSQIDEIWPPKDGDDKTVTSLVAN